MLPGWWSQNELQLAGNWELVVALRSLYSWRPRRWTVESRVLAWTQRSVREHPSRFLPEMCWRTRYWWRGCGVSRG